jgi:hypothetical protein
MLAVTALERFLPKEIDLSDEPSHAENHRSTPDLPS